MAIALLAPNFSRVCGERALDLGLDRRVDRERDVGARARPRWSASTWIGRPKTSRTSTRRPGVPVSAVSSCFSMPERPWCVSPVRPITWDASDAARQEALVGVREVDAGDAERARPVGRRGRHVAREHRVDGRAATSVLASVLGSRLRIGASWAATPCGSVTRLGEAVTSTARRSVARSVPSRGEDATRARRARGRRSGAGSPRGLERSPARTVPEEGRAQRRAGTAAAPRPRPAPGSAASGRGAAPGAAGAAPRGRSARRRAARAAILRGHRYGAAAGSR